MREICTSGSEGGGAGTTGAPYPYHVFPLCHTALCATQLRRGWPAFAGHDTGGGMSAAACAKLYGAWYYDASPGQKSFLIA
jgi:hypothetical protein